jgi:hypothetical protein
MNFVNVRKINQKEIRKRKKEVPRATPDHFWGTSTTKTRSKNGKILPLEDF